MKSFAFALSLSSFVFFACTSEPPTAKFIVKDEKVALKEWPDSNYIANMDSILKMESVKKTAEAEANIKMNVFEAPVFKLPTKANQPQQSTVKKQPTKAAKVDNSLEAFANKFANALSKFQSDPSNKNLYKNIEAKENEDLFNLLQRAYGKSVQNLPRFFILSALQSVNPGVKLEHLKAGDLVRVPKIN